MRDVIRGSCLCGGVRFEIRGRPVGMSYCHCGRCRKVGGTTANVLVHAKDLRWVQGAELVRQYQPEEPFNLVRCFCSVCGTYLGEAEMDGGVTIAATAFDDDPLVRPRAHGHVADKAPWYSILDDLPQYEGEPPLSVWGPEHEPR